MWAEFFHLIVYILATYRLTILFYYDNGPWDSIDWFRAKCGVRASMAYWKEGRLVRWSENRHIGALLNCPYCLSAWFAALVLIPYFLTYGGFGSVLLWLAVWGGATLLLERSTLKVEVE